MKYEYEDLPPYDDGFPYSNEADRLTKLYHVRWRMRFNPTWTIFHIDVKIADTEMWSTLPESKDSDWQIIETGPISIAMKITWGS